MLLLLQNDIIAVCYIGFIVSANVLADSASTLVARASYLVHIAKAFSLPASYLVHSAITVLPCARYLVQPANVVLPCATTPAGSANVFLLPARYLAVITGCMVLTKTGVGYDFAFTLHCYFDAVAVFKKMPTEENYSQVGIDMKSPYSITPPSVSGCEYYFQYLKNDNLMGLKSDIVVVEL